MFWREGVTRSFAEIPVSGAPFVSIEVQRVEYRGVGGILVALHRPAGPVEIYAEPRLGLDRTWFDGDPAFGQFDNAVLAETSFEVARCVVEAGSVDMEVQFVDASGRRVTARAAHRFSLPVAPLATPAPLQDNPITLRFLHMNEFRLLPTRGSDIEVTVDGRPAEVKRLLGVAWIPLTQARMSTDLLLAGLAPAHENRSLMDDQEWEHRDRGSTVVVTDDQLIEVAIANAHGRFAIRFDDPLPNPVGIGTSQGRQGRLSMTSPLGPLAVGRWELARADSGVSFRLADVRQDWSPPLRQPTRVVLRHVRRLRRRRLVWSYDALLSEGENGWTSTGSWSIATG